MAKLKVYRCMLGGRAEVMVAAGSRKAAAELMGLSAYELWFLTKKFVKRQITLTTDK
jgi:hypothetical protein